MASVYKEGLLDRFKSVAEGRVNDMRRMKEMDVDVIDKNMVCRGINFLMGNSSTDFSVSMIVAFVTTNSREDREMKAYYTTWCNTLTGVDRSNQDEAVQLLREFIRHALTNFTPPSGSGETKQSLETDLMEEARTKLDGKLPR